MSKILMHFTDFGHKPERRKKNTFGALGYYRIFKPSQCIKGHEVKVVGTDIVNYGDDFASNWDNIFKEYDVFWALHFLGDPNAAAQAYLSRLHDKILIYDLDDNYLDVPESNPAHEKFQKGKRDRGIMSASFFFADGLTVSTEPLKERMEEYFESKRAEWEVEVRALKRNPDFGHLIKEEPPKVYVIPNMNDVKDWDFKPAPKHDDKIVIGYSGSNSHQDDLLLVLPAINRLLSKYPNLWFETIGAIEKSKLGMYFDKFEPTNLDRVAMLPATATFWEYPPYLAQQKWDIGIAPLVDTPFTRSKSHIKWLEYSMFNIPTVASRVYPYFMDIEGRKTIEHGDTGFLCRDPEWESTLEKLILDKGLREKIGAQAREAIIKNWQYENSEISATVDKMLSEVRELKNASK